MELESPDAVSTSGSSLGDNHSSGGGSDAGSSNSPSHKQSSKAAPAAKSATLPRVPLSSSNTAAAGEHSSYQDLETWLSKLQQGTPLTETEVKSLTELARERLLLESNVQPVQAPVTVSCRCGSIL